MKDFSAEFKSLSQLGSSGMDLNQKILEFKIGIESFFDEIFRAGFKSFAGQVRQSRLVFMHLGQAGRKWAGTGFTHSLQHPNFLNLSQKVLLWICYKSFFIFIFLLFNMLFLVFINMSQIIFFLETIWDQ